MERISWVPDVALSGVTSIPGELLDVIFESAAAPDSNSFPVSRNSMPWALTRVCSQWRKIALRNEKLWRIFHMDLGGTTDTVKLLDTLQTMGLGHHIRFVLTDCSGRLPVNMRVRWDFILPNNIMHVERLFMRLTDSSIVPFLFRGPDMMKLKTLSLMFHPSHPEVMMQWPPIYETIVTRKSPTIFVSMRNLRQLEIFAVSRRPTGSLHALMLCEDIPWSQLTSFRVFSLVVDMAALQACLSECASLTYLNLEVSDTGIHFLPAIDHSPKLRRLNYSMGNPNCLPMLGIPWKQLKTVHLNDSSDDRFIIPFSDLLGVLYDLEDVEILFLRVMHPDDIMIKVDSLRQLYFPHLKTLYLKASLPEILLLFKVPALEILSLYVPGGHRSILTPLSQVINASSCSIKAFDCTDNKTSTWVIPPAETEASPDYLMYHPRRLKRFTKFIAKYMPRLERFGGFTMKFPIKLMLKMAAGLAFPRLQTMACVIPSSHVDLLLDVIEACAEGRGHRGRLWKVFAAIYGEVSESTRDRLDAVGQDLGVTFEKRIYDTHMFNRNFT